MAKKIISFIVILLAYSIIGTGFLLLVQSNILDTTEYEIKNAFALDRAGNMYYVSYKSDKALTKYLTARDSAGNLLFEKELSTEQFGESFYIDGTYVEYDGSIYLTAYDYDYLSGSITRASVHRFHEDGSYDSMIFTEDIRITQNALSHVISAFSEDDDNIYFSILTDEKARIFTVSKNGSQPAEKVGEIDVEGDFYGFVTLSKDSIAVGGTSGITVYSKDTAQKIGKNDNAVFDRFWNGIDMFYAMDSVGGNIYVVSRDNSMVNVLNSSKTINTENGLTLADMDDFAVSITGSIMGTIRGDRLRVFSGSFSVMSEIFLNETNSWDTINSILIYIAVAVAVILLTVLTWDFFCSILKMRLSIMLRQSLLILMAVTVMLYSFSWFVISPSLGNLGAYYSVTEFSDIANIFVEELRGASSLDSTSALDAYEKLFNSYGRDDPDFEEHRWRSNTPMVSIIERKNGRFYVIASSDLYPKGYPGNMLSYTLNPNEAIHEDMRGIYLQGLSIYGLSNVYMTSVDLPVTDNPTFIFIESEAYVQDLLDEKYFDDLLWFLIPGGVALVLIFMIIESITARAVRKLKRSVDKIALGEYNTTVNIRTGDEVEELSVSVQALADHILEKTTSLERLNSSYHRFVPQSFLTTLGENQIERVEKSLYAKKHMAVLFLRFSFSQPLSGMEAQEIFSNINSVYEHIVPIIDANGGTAYNFLFNGLNAIFHDSTEHALQAAIRIRETIAAYNDLQRSKNSRTADVRIVISEGEVLLGFIGDDRRMEPTAVSAAINEAEEIEKILTDSGLYIVCTERAFHSLPEGKYRSRFIGSFVTAEGERLLYDMFDSDPYTMIKLKEQFEVRFELGVSLFKKQDFTNARNVFMDIVKYAADDGVSRNYMYLSERNITAEKKQLTYTVYSDDFDMN